MENTGNYLIDMHNEGHAATESVSVEVTGCANGDTITGELARANNYYCPECRAALMETRGEYYCPTALLGGV